MDSICDKQKFLGVVHFFRMSLTERRTDIAGDRLRPERMPYTY